MQLNRVVITGRGAVSPFGIGVAQLNDKIWDNSSGVEYMSDWAANCTMNSLLAAPAPEIDGKKVLARSLRRTMGKTAIFATLAAKEAVANARLTDDQLKSGRVGTVIGSTTGSPTSYESFYERYLPEKAVQGIKSGEFFKMMSHTSAANVCLALGIEGQQWAPASACTSAAQAIGLALMLIQTGRQDIVICGGSDEVHPSVTGVFEVVKAASFKNDSPKSSPSPFDKDRDGVVCGEGSGILVLESLESANRRGADIIAEVLGFGNVSDSRHIANPGKDAMARAMTASLDEANVAPDEIDYVNAHATGTEQGDVAESEAIHEIVGETTPVSSLKGHIGHTLGAAGSLETIIVLEMLIRQELIPTRNLINTDPACSMINLLKEKKKQTITTVLKNNFALGGVNAALVLRRYSE